MADWVIGDLQGCDASLQRLLAELSPGEKDQLSFVGDLVNRGPGSLAALRRVRKLCDSGRARTVLGNHDLHLLAAAEGIRPLSASDTLADILSAPDRDGLLDWLARQPLLLRDEGPAGVDLIVHAGLHPAWDLDTAQACCSEVTALLGGRQRAAFLARMYGNQPDRWSPTLDAEGRQRFTVNACTRMRLLTRDSQALLLKAKGGVADGPADAVAWFAAPHARPAGSRVFFGHWSTLERVAWPEHGVWCLDTGCVWGGRLSAFDRIGGALVSLPAAAGDSRNP